MVAIQLINFVTGYSLNGFGIIPRTPSGLLGVVCNPFLHASFSHLISNLAPFLVLGWLVATRSHGQFLTVSAIVIVLGGLFVWAFGRNSIHVGASGWIFGLWAYLIARAWFERSLASLAIATFVVLAYGGLIFGLLPNRFFSFEAHIGGAIAGVLAAMLLHKQSG